MDLDYQQTLVARRAEEEEDADVAATALGYSAVGEFGDTSLGVEAALDSDSEPEDDSDTENWANFSTFDNSAAIESLRSENLKLTETAKDEIRAAMEGFTLPTPTWAAAVKDDHLLEIVRKK